ncbi:hypothetical protein NC653_006729 [Populus alba x Populus x berolinensis]|uniref:Uncharacterized protein n=1 Tax=Populus alba x Populus x berolinensis TaxID=444605 RepID=A0AAD6RFG5_9ROSI|nr:hypothetical protein NC653_006729 [Populus alba x Populus x berolinensis]
MTLEINNKFSQREYQRASSTTTTPASYIRCTHTLTSLRHVSPDVGLALSLPLSPPPFLHFSSPQRGKKCGVFEVGVRVSSSSYFPLSVRELKQFFHINS